MTPSQVATSSAVASPLVVRLEGGLVRTDVTLEATLSLLKHRPSLIFALVWWWLRGVWKSEVAARAPLEVPLLPYRTEVRDRLAQERAKGTRLVLLARCESALAQAVALHLGGFDEVLAGEGDGAVTTALPQDGFHLLAGRGDAPALFSRARSILLVEGCEADLERLRRKGLQVESIGTAPAPSWRIWFKALRVHQWAKNLLLFVPLVAAHRASDLALLRDAVIAFVTFSACASSTYLLNDLVDLPSDRRHARKSRRPFAAGTLPLAAGLVMIPALLLAAFAMAALLLSPTFVALLGGYCIATLAYSLRLKQIVILDVLMLSGLYTVRILSGAAATGVVVSDWLLIFSIFLFLSLALVKRLSEVLKLPESDSGAHGRGYVRGDAGALGQLGVAAGYISILVLALYIHSPEITRLYAHQEWLWLLCPVALLWISRVWLLTHRGQMDEDPVVFALRDRVSYAVAAVAACVLWLAT